MLCLTEHIPYITPYYYKKHNEDDAHQNYEPQEMLLALISVRGRVDPRATVRSEGFYVNEKSTDTSWDRISDLPIWSTAP